NHCYFVSLYILLFYSITMGKTMSLNAISANLTSTKLILPAAVFGMMLGLAGCSNSSTTEESVEVESTETGAEQQAATDEATTADSHIDMVLSTHNKFPFL
ncbi:hypothetical protein R0K04_21870, partial [Pseudoalteromonas sp. SIMBA_153]